MVELIVDTEVTGPVADIVVVEELVVHTAVALAEDTVVEFAADTAADTAAELAADTVAELAAGLCSVVFLLDIPV